MKRKKELGRWEGRDEEVEHMFYFEKTGDSLVCLVTDSQTLVNITNTRLPTENENL
jgi:hypothetical protein